MPIFETIYEGVGYSQGCHSKNTKKEETERELKFSAFFKKNYALILFIISV